MLHRQLDQQQIVDDRKGQYRRIQEGNEKKPRRAKPAREGHDSLLPSTKARRHSPLLSPIHVLPSPRGAFVALPEPTLWNEVSSCSNSRRVESNQAATIVRRRRDRNDS